MDRSIAVDDSRAGLDVDLGAAVSRQPHFHIARSGLDDPGARRLTLEGDVTAAASNPHVVRLIQQFDIARPGIDVKVARDVLDMDAA